jgi:hypothetical protein
MKNRKQRIGLLPPLPSLEAGGFSPCHDQKMDRKSEVNVLMWDGVMEKEFRHFLVKRE